MEVAIQAVLIIGAFSLAHERLVELVRSFGMKVLPSRAKWIDKATRNGWAALTGTALALATNANLLKAFTVGEGGQSKFFECYLNGFPWGVREIFGCVLMGLAVTYGSVFWHDLAKLLIDARGQLNPLKRAQQVAEAAEDPRNPVKIAG